LTQTLPLAFAAAISGLEAVAGAALVVVLVAAGVALGLAGAACFAAAELAPLELACAFAKAGEMATVSIRQKASIQKISFLGE